MGAQIFSDKWSLPVCRQWRLNSGEACSLGGKEKGRKGWENSFTNEWLVFQRSKNKHMARHQYFHCAMPLNCGAKAATANSRLADASLLRTTRYYGQTVKFRWIRITENNSSYYVGPDGHCIWFTWHNDNVLFQKTSIPPQPRQRVFWGFNPSTPMKIPGRAHTFL